MNSEPIVGSEITPSEKNYLLIGKNRKDEKIFVDSLKLTTHGGIVAEAKKDETIFVSGVDVGFPEVRVSTTGEYVNTMIHFAEKRKRMQTLMLLKQLEIKLRSADVDALYQQGGDAWKDFCSDIVDFYCFRFRVFKIPMPVCVNESSAISQTVHSSEAASPCATEER